MIKAIGPGPRILEAPYAVGGYTSGGRSTDSPPAGVWRARRILFLSIGVVTPAELGQGWFVAC